MTGSILSTGIDQNVKFLAERWCSRNGDTGPVTLIAPRFTRVFLTHGSGKRKRSKLVMLSASGSATRAGLLMPLATVGKLLAHD